MTRAQRRGQRLVAILTVVAAVAAATTVDAARLRELTKLTPPAGVPGFFGFDVAVDDGLALVGNSTGSSAAAVGSAFVYDARTGELLTKLRPPGNDGDPTFGYSVALSDGVALVGESFFDDRGRAHLFNARTGEHLWTLEAPSDEGSFLFGHGVAIEGDIALVLNKASRGIGAGSGAVHVFEVTTGEVLDRLIPVEGDLGTTAGGGLAIAGGVAAVSTDFDAASLFDVETGRLVAEFDNSPLQRDWTGGLDIAIDDAIALLGRRASGIEPRPVYTASVPSGERIATLLPDTQEPLNDFGVTIALDGRYALVGSAGSAAGNLWLFDARTGEQLDVELVNQPVFFSAFGAIAMDDGLAVVGDSTFRGPDFGPIAYVYEVVPEPHAAGLVALLLAAGGVTRPRRGLGHAWT